MRLKGIVGPAYTLASLNAACQRCVNLYPELYEAPGREGEVGYLMGTPGLRLLATIGSGPLRCAYRASNGYLFVVSGAEVYYVDTAYATTLVGTLPASATTPASMADNGTHVIVVDGTNAASFSILGTDFATIATQEFFGGVTVSFQDGYFLVTSIGTSGIFQISTLYANDFTGFAGFDGLDYATAEGSPDKLMSHLTSNRNLWLFGEVSTEVWYNAGNPDFPFQRVDGAFIEIGCAAKYSPAKLSNTVVWLGSDSKGAGMVWQAQGFQPKRISTHAIEQEFRTYSTISDAVGWSYQDGGHYFYVLNFPTADKTWVYDDSTRLWHERMYLESGDEQRHRGMCHAYWNGLHAVGDYEDGKLYAMEYNTYTDNGAEIRRVRSGMHHIVGLNRVEWDFVQLDVESGVGLSGSGQGISPQIMMRYSDDGGHRWSNEKWRTPGAIGNTKTRVIWRRLGVSRDRVYEFSISDPVKVVIFGAEASAKKLGG